MHNFDILSTRAAVTATSAGTELSYGKKAFVADRPFLDVLTVHNYDWVFMSLDPNEAYENLEEMESDIASSTTAWINKGLKLLNLYNEGVQIAWASTLGPFEFSASAKLGKRLSLFAWQTDATLMGVNVEVVEGKTLHDPTVLTIQFTDDDTPLTDGISFIRYSVWMMMVNTALERNKSHYRKAIDLNGRLVMPDGLIKGNFRVLPDDLLDADVVTSRSNNLKTELWSNDGKAYFAAYPEHTNWFGEVTLDRQTRMHFFDPLFTIEMIETWFEMWTNRIIADLNFDVMPSWATDPRRVEGGDGTINAYTERFVKFADAGLAPSASPALLQALVRNAEMMLNPSSRKIDSLKFPIEFAVRVLLRSESDMPKGFRKLMPHQAYVDRHALVVSDEAYAKIASILGGADKDDHVVVHFRRDPKTGAIYIAVIRNPIGGGFDKNGRRCSEYVLLTCVNAVELLDDHYGEGNWVLPESDPRLMPTRIDFGEFAEDTFVPEGIDAAEYTPDLVFELARGAAIAAQVYGSHANKMVAAISTNIPLTHFAMEETFVDTCQQVTAPNDVMEIKRINSIHDFELATALQSTPMDRTDFTRIEKSIRRTVKAHNLAQPMLVDGLATELAAIHRKHLNRMRTRANELMKVTIAGVKLRFPYNPGMKRYAGVDVVQPWIMGGITRKMDLVAKDGGVMTTAIYDEAGDALHDWIVEHMDANQLIRDVLGFVGAYAKRREADAVQWRNIDSCLLNGKLIDLYIPFLQDTL